MTTGTKAAAKWRDLSRGWDNIVAGEKTDKYKSPDKESQSGTKHSTGKKKREKQLQEQRRQEKSK